MSITKENEFESLMRQQVDSDNKMTKNLVDYLDEEDKKQGNKYYAELYKEFDELYKEKDVYAKAESSNEEKIEDLSDEELEKISEDDLDEKVIEDGKEYTRRQLLYKELYRRNLQKYYNLRAEIHKQDIKKDGDISFNDYNFSKVLEYEIYLRKIDSKFKNMTGNYVAKEFDDVNAELNECVSEELKYDKTLDKDWDKSYAKISQYNEALDEISDKISLLDSSDDSYEEKYNALMDRYAEITSKLHMLEPNVLELQEQEDRRKEQDMIVTKKVGRKYERDERKSYNARNLVKSNNEEKEDKKTGMYYKEDSTRTGEELESTLDSHIQVIKANIEAIKEKLEKEDYDGLEQLILDTQNMIKVYNIDREALEGELQSEDIDLVVNMDIDELRTKKKDRENNKDAVEKDDSFASELERVASDYEIANHIVENNKEIDEQFREII